MNKITTLSGVLFDFNKPEEHTYPIEEIARALSNLCRYTGHTNHFYSVAQHSVLVSKSVPHRYAMAALLHDAAEAYVGDVSSPLKEMLPDYRAVEARVEAAIAERYSWVHGLYPLNPVIKSVDVNIRDFERRMIANGRVTGVEAWTPTRAYNEFMLRVRGIEYTNRYGNLQENNNADARVVRGTYVCSK